MSGTLDMRRLWLTSSLLFSLMACHHHHGHSEDGAGEDSSAISADDQAASVLTSTLSNPAPVAPTVAKTGDKGTAAAGSSPAAITVAASPDVVVTKTPLADGSAGCPSGGVEIVTFIDKTGSGAFDAGADTGYTAVNVCDTKAAVIAIDEQNVAAAQQVLVLAQDRVTAAQAAVASATALASGSTAMGSGSTSAGMGSGTTGMSSGTTGMGSGSTGMGSGTTSMGSGTTGKGSGSTGSGMSSGSVALAEAEATATSAAAQLAADTATYNSDNTTLQSMAGALDTSRIDWNYGTPNALSPYTADGICDLYTNAKTDQSDMETNVATDTAQVSLVDQEAAVASAATTLTAALADDDAADTALSGPLATLTAQLTLRENGTANTYAAAAAAFQAAQSGLTSGAVEPQTGSLYAYNVALAAVARTLADSENLSYYSALATQVANLQIEFSIVAADENALTTDQAMLAADDNSVTALGGTISSGSGSGTGGFGASSPPPSTETVLVAAEAQLAAAETALTQAQAALVLAQTKLANDTAASGGT